jgi:hypothetical protein
MVSFREPAPKIPPRDPAVRSLLDPSAFEVDP